MFHGCGFINQCYGDILIKNNEESTIVEVKAGERNFTISDLRQILIYAGLDYIHNQVFPTYNRLYNPLQTALDILTDPKIFPVSEAFSNISVAVLNILLYSPSNPPLYDSVNCITVNSPLTV